jgi:excisionase family DNA binding protein
MQRTTENHDEAGAALFTFTEAAERLRVRESWLRRQVTAKAIPHRRIGRVVRFAQHDLDEIVARSAVTPDEAISALRPSRRRRAS